MITYANVFLKETIIHIVYLDPKGDCQDIIVIEILGQGIEFFSVTVLETLFIN